MTRKVLQLLREFREVRSELEKELKLLGGRLPTLIEEDEFFEALVDAEKIQNSIDGENCRVSETLPWWGSIP